MNTIYRISATVLLLLTAALSAGASDGVQAPLPGYNVSDAFSLKTEGLAATRSGSLWMSLGGTFENGSSAVLLCKMNGDRWNDDAGVVLSARHGVLWADPMGALRLFYTQDGVLYCTVCMDPDADSPQWNVPVRLGEGYAGGTPVFTGRTLMLPVMVPEKGPGVFTSANNGISWTFTDGPRDVPELQKAVENNPELYVSGRNEVSMVIRSVGTAWAWRSVSTDGGNTWSKPSHFIYNPATDLSVTALGGGKTAVVKNCRYDNKVYHQKKGLYVYITPNNGELWYGGLQVDGREDVSDPVSVIADGRINVAYTRVVQGTNEILFASMTEKEVDEAWGTLATAPSVRNIVFSAGKSQQAFDDRLKGLSAGSGEWADKTLKVATYNIIYHRYVKNPTWEQRRVVLKKMWEKYGFDIVGSQEPDTMQIRTLVETLGEDFSWVGTIRENPLPDKKGEVLAVNPIFYRKTRLEVLDKGVIIYGDAVGVQGYDASGYGRNCNWAKFRDKETGKVFFCFNSHLDHRGLEAKEYSPVVLLKEAAEISKGLPCVFTGDFNLDEDNPGYSKMVTSGWTADAMLALPEKKRVNWEYASMAKFKPLSTVAKRYRHIDHIFYTPSNSKVLSWQLITDSYDGIYGSDHLPIVIDWKIAN